MGYLPDLDKFGPWFAFYVRLDRRFIAFHERYHDPIFRLMLDPQPALGFRKVSFEQRLDVANRLLVFQPLQRFFKRYTLLLGKSYGVSNQRVVQVELGNLLINGISRSCRWRIR